MKQNRWLAIGMMLMWGFVLSINILYRHAHRLPDGRIVSHVHPFRWTGEKGPLPYNPHTTSELAWLDAYSNNPYTGDFVVSEYTFAAPAIPEEKPVEIYGSAVVSLRTEPESPRGPPALIS